MLVITIGLIPLKSPFCWLNPIKPPFSYGFPMVFAWGHRSHRPAMDFRQKKKGLRTMVWPPHESISEVLRNGRRSMHRWCPTHKTHGENGGLTKKNGGLTEKNGGLTKRNGGLTKRNGGLTKRNGGLTKKNGGLTEKNGGLTKRNGGLTKRNGGLTKRKMVV